MLQRKVGRPAKGGAEVGKKGLISRARAELRRERFDVFQRKDLAAACAVTPALISYYFKDNDEVFDEIVTKVVEQHVDRLIEIVRSNKSLDAKYASSVDYLIEAFRLDINFFDTYENALAIGLRRNMDLIALAQEELKSLFQECFRIGMPTCFDKSVFHGAVWGMCRAAARFKGPELAQIDRFEERKIIDIRRSVQSTAVSDEIRSGSAV